MNWTADFPILAADENGKRLVYLDSAATTQHPSQVLNAVVNYYNKENANPHRGVYELAMRATDAHEGARHTVAQFFNAEDDEIVFTQNTTESLNLVAYSYGMNFLHEGDEIVISVAEHHSNMVPWLVYMYPGENGRLTTEELDKKITSKTKVVAVAMVSNVLGLRAPVEEIVKRAHAVGAVVVLDCAQSAPHTPVDVKKLDVDFAACSAHKLYAPMGVGALYARAELLEKMPPFLSGGDMIAAVHESGATWADGPRKFEAGTRNVGGEVGFAAAIDYMNGIGWQAMEAHEHMLLDRMLAGMRHAVADRLRRAGGRGPLRRRQLQRQRGTPPRRGDDSGCGRRGRARRASLCPAPDGIPGHRQLLPRQRGDLQHARGRGRPAGKSCYITNPRSD